MRGLSHGAVWREKADARLAEFGLATIPIETKRAGFRGLGGAIEETTATWRALVGIRGGGVPRWKQQVEGDAPTLVAKEVSSVGGAPISAAAARTTGRRRSTEWASAPEQGASNGGFVRFQ